MTEKKAESKPAEKKAESKPAENNEKLPEASEQKKASTPTSSTTGAAACSAGRPRTT